MKAIKRAIVASVIFGMVGMAQAAAVDTDDDGYRQINQVAWDKTGGDYRTIVDENIPREKTNIVFIRQDDDDPVETSLNIGIDGKFQVSLQPGHFSEVTTCAGAHDINIVPTREKTNKLSSGQQINLAPQQTHYFFIEVDGPKDLIQLYKIDRASALELLATKTEQTHQLSRVSDVCPEVVTPPPVIEIDKPVRLDVLFDFDSARVKPVYNQDIAAVAQFMIENPDTVTLVEGHTDSTGPASYNMGLSQRRADAVKGELVNRYGTDNMRITTKGYGETQPIATNSTKAGRQQNRRVIATVTNPNANENNMDSIVPTGDTYPANNTNMPVDNAPANMPMDNTGNDNNSLDSDTNMMPMPPLGNAQTRAPEYLRDVNIDVDTIPDFDSWADMDTMSNLNRVTNYEGAN